jgi:transcriptional regulator with XRE-family HTH domain
MLPKKDLYKKAIALRSKGYSYNEILDFIHVSNSTLSRWCSGIELTNSQKERLLDKKRNTVLIYDLKKKCSESKAESKKWAVENASQIESSKESLLLLGAVLYWAEGTKSGAGSSVEFTNTDPNIIRIMMRFFREILFTPEQKFRLMVRIGEEKNIAKAEKYWSAITGLPASNFRKPEILKNIKKNSKNRYPNGICRIAVHDVLSRRKLIDIIEEISKIF